MKKKLFLLIGLLCMTTFGCFSQNMVKVDYKQMKDFVKNHSSDFNALLNRYEANDTLLTVNDLAHIYFGYSFTKFYLGSFDDFTPFTEFIEQGKYEEGYQWGIEHLKKNPVSLRLLYEMYGLAGELGKSPEETNSYIIKYFQLLDMISQTGDGQSKETAYKVICINDEYHILQIYWKIEKLHTQSLIEHYDVMEFDPIKNYKGDKMYFDISRSLDSMKELFK